VQADADIMLIDEVLAVGDAGFAQKCMDVFHEKREAGRTIVLVTHDMAMVQSLCDRAMLLHDGELKFIGDPVGCAQRYYRLNHGIARNVSDEELERQVNAAIVHDAVRVVRAGFRDAEGRAGTNVEQGEPLRLEIVLETRRELERPRFVMHVLTEDGTVVFEFTLEPDEGRLAAGRRFRLAGEVENPLVPGRYILDIWVGQQFERGSDVQGIRLLHFLVYGASARHGIVSVDTRLALEPEEDT
jgi:ABC-2 type transport system ATP-binding protein